MKKIEAIIRPGKWEEVQQALASIQIDGITLSELKGVGRQPGHMEIYRGNKVKVDFVSKLKLDILVEDHQVDACINVLTTAARTGNMGDGKIIVTNVENLIRIRTGEKNSDAI